jgi:uncharacterized protein YdeI (YjbR/CyaY-like superfamily)
MATLKAFSTPALFRSWLAEHHDSATELWIKFWKKSSGKKGLTYKEALDEALCFGWIDGHIKPIDDTCYSQRWTPRRKGSIWSNVNVAKARALIESGRMMPAGLRAFEAREKVGVYSFENKEVELSAAYARKLKANAAAARFFASQAPSYRRIAAHWVMTAKQEATRERRLQQLIDCSAAGNKIPSQRRPNDK